MLKKNVKILADHFKLWNGWRKGSRNSKLYKLAVLFRLANSPSFEFYKFDKFLEMQRKGAD